MCMMFYLGSDAPVEEEPWSKGKNLSLYVQGLHESQAGVVRQFSKRHVYDLIAQSGCGCGFMAIDAESALEYSEKVEGVRASRERMAEMLRAALRNEKSLELYICWAGDEGRDPDYRRESTPEELAGMDFDFREREFIKIVHSH